MSAFILTVEDLRRLFQPKCFSDSLELRAWTSTSSKPEFLQLLAQPREEHGEVSRSGSHTGMSGQELTPLGFMQSGTRICGYFTPTTLVWLHSIPALKQVQPGFLPPSWNVTNNISRYGNHSVTLLGGTVCSCSKASVTVLSNSILIPAFFQVSLKNHHLSEHCWGRLGGLGWSFLWKGIYCLSAHCQVSATFPADNLEYKQPYCACHFRSPLINKAQEGS